jgi:serine/threonine-protein kinase
MDATTWAAMKGLLADVAGLPAAEREPYIRQNCPDPALRETLLDLVADPAALSDFFTRPTLVHSTRIGVYVVDVLLDRGGMGEVYRARDTKLGRDVALKVLPSTFATDPERLARLEREARLLASLNHPNIAHVYGLEESNGVRALVMELVEGETLADRLTQGAIPMTEALGIAHQICEALEAAHEHGIIHRDLKPANIKVRPDGTAKVLDFGLAKIAAPPSAAVMNSPTLTVSATQQGLILGTAAYMSPEQASGKPVDRRTDLWSFGVVLMEMLTGRRVFTGETVSDVIAAVLKTPPDWTALSSDTPASVRRLLRRCLDKDPRRRLDSAGAARLDLDDALEPDERRFTRRSSLTIGASAIAGAFTGALMLALVWSAWLRGTPPSAAMPMPVRYTVEAAPRATFQTTDMADIAISPNGTRFVYVAGTSVGDQHLEMRSIDSLAATPLGQLKGVGSPVFSPDGQSVAFWTGLHGGETRLWRMPTTGGAAVPICRLPVPNTSNLIVARGTAWADDNSIWFATSNTTAGLWHVHAGVGEPTRATTPDTAHGEVFHLFPDPLPRGRGVLFTILSAGGAKSQVAVLDLRSGRIKTLIQGGRAKYVKTGHLLYVSGRSLLAVAFNPDTLSITSDPVPVLSEVQTSDRTGAGDFAISDAGTLAYVPATSALRTLTWVDRTGREQAIAAPPRPYTHARISPDGSRIALSIADEDRDIFVWNIAQGSLTRITTDPGLDDVPIWSGDRRIVFASDRAGVFNLYSHAADGTGSDDRLTTSPNPQWPDSFTPDGRLVFTEEMDSSRHGRHAGLMLLAQPPSQDPSPLFQSPGVDQNGEISPDGRWIAYESDYELFVRPFPNPSRTRWRISRAFGRTPVWSRDGRELFYRAADSLAVAATTSEMVAVSVRHDPRDPDFHASAPTSLFPLVYRAVGVDDRTYDVARDGRFVMIKDAPPTDEKPHFVVVVNWFTELQQRVPTR